MRNSRATGNTREFREILCSCKTLPYKSWSGWLITKSARNQGNIVDQRTLTGEQEINFNNIRILQSFPESQDVESVWEKFGITDAEKDFILNFI